MTRILITGSDSFIGNNFISFSKFRDVKSVSLRKLSPAGIDFSDFDVVLHLAAIVHFTRDIRKEDYYRINRDLSLEVARCARAAGVIQFIFLSTVKVYGKFKSDSEVWREDSPCKPTDHYGKSKYEAELELEKLADNSFIVSIIRTPVVYGSGVKANILKLIRIVEMLPILPFAKIENKRNFTYIENLVGYIDRIIEKRSAGVFISMDDNSLSTTNFVNYISKYLGKKIFLFKLPTIFVRIGIFIFPNLFDRLFGSFELNNSKTKKILDYNPPYSTEEGIKKMILSFKKNR